MEDERQGIARNVELVIEQLGPVSGLDFGLTRESVVWVEGFIERQRARPGFDPDSAGGLVGTLGSFLGECIAANADGRWHEAEDHGWGILLPGNNYAFPFRKVDKQFREGLTGGESIVSFYDIAVDYVAKGKLNQ